LTYPRNARTRAFDRPSGASTSPSFGSSRRRIASCGSLRGTFDPRDLDADWEPLAGSLLPDWYDDWVLLERERYRQLGLHALEMLSEHLTAARRFGPALEAALAAVAGEPFRESAHRVLIKAHLAEGNASEAIRQYDFYRKLVNDHLGLDPSPAMDALLEGLTIR
jgi:DNA-binding SARP family transcriptional activator